MTVLTEYKDSFSHIGMEREGGILQIQLHTGGGPLRWTTTAHDQLAHAFRDIARDRENLVMIITGSGNEFCGPRAENVASHRVPAEDWEELHATGMELMDALLSISALVIAAVNGPALRHCELALMSDIVLASETAEFQDSAHFPNGMTPGDGVNVIFPLVMGLTRARYFHLTGQVIKAQRAHELGLVNEVLPPADLLPRAWELARHLTNQRPMIIRHTRLLFTQDLRRRMVEMVGYGLALEGLDAASSHDRVAGPVGEKGR
jgi:enoyl-CoA hydratase/carnithine racemase